MKELLAVELGVGGETIDKIYGEITDIYPSAEDGDLLWEEALEEDSFQDGISKIREKYNISTKSIKKVFFFMLENKKEEGNTNQTMIDPQESEEDSFFKEITTSKEDTEKKDDFEEVQPAMTSSKKGKASDKNKQQGQKKAPGVKKLVGIVLAGMVILFLALITVSTFLMDDDVDSTVKYETEYPTKANSKNRPAVTYNKVHSEPKKKIAYKNVVPSVQSTKEKQKTTKKETQKKNGYTIPTKELPKDTKSNTEEDLKNSLVETAFIHSKQASKFSASSSNEVCYTGIPYQGQELVYYVKNGINFYVAVSEINGWNGKGIKVSSSTKPLSKDETSGMIEVAKGKYLPEEVFGSCVGK